MLHFLFWVYLEGLRGQQLHGVAQVAQGYGVGVDSKISY